MSEQKRYFWLKLKDDFFKQKEIKMLRRIAGGDTYTIIYLKMLLLSLKQNGKIYYDGIADSMIDEIALEIDEDEDNVKIAYTYLLSKGLIINAQDEVNMTEIQKMIGSETDSAERVRRHRQKALQSNTPVTEMKRPCNTEIEIEKEIELDIDKEKKPTRHKHGEYGHILLTDDQFSKLLKDFKEHALKNTITKMDEWIQIKGKSPYKDYNLALRKWLKAESGQGIVPLKKTEFTNYDQRTYDYSSLEKSLLGGEER